MSVSSQYALKAIVKGLRDSGALNVAQLHKIMDALEDAAATLDSRGRKQDALEIREIIDFGFGVEKDN
jgi:hypothetical protein